MQDKSAEKAAHESDLDGFWEMIFYQVEDVHKRFEELNKLQENGWVAEAQQVPQVKKPIAVKKSTKTVKPKKVWEIDPTNVSKKMFWLLVLCFKSDKQTQTLKIHCCIHLRSLFMNAL